MRNIPTLDQREAMTMEVAQSISKVASNLLEVNNLNAWRDLPNRLRMKLISSFISTLQQFLLILPRTITNDREVSLSSPNLCKYFFVFLYLIFFSLIFFFSYSLQ